MRSPRRRGPEPRRACLPLDPLQDVLAEVAVGCAGVHCGLRLQEQDLALFVRHRPVLDALWDHGELARSKLDGATSQLDPKASFDHIEELVFMLVVVPDEIALELDGFDVEVIDLADDLRGPVFLDAPELVLDIHFLNQLATSWAFNLDFSAISRHD